MRIIIVGAGFTGCALARSLIAAGESVTLVDSDEKVIARAAASLDCATLCAPGNSLNTLQEAGIASADALVAVTASDEINILTCSLADLAYPAVTKIGRVRGSAYYLEGENPKTNKNVQQDEPPKQTESPKHDENRRFGVDWMISPDEEVAEAIVQAVEHGATGDVTAFNNSPFVLTRTQIAENSALCRKKLSDARTLAPFPFLIAFVESESDTPDALITLPSGNSIIPPDCTLGVVIRKEDTPAFLELCGTKPKTLRNIAIVGAGHIGTIIADQLLMASESSLADSVPAQSVSKKWTTAIKTLASLISRKSANFSRPPRRIVIIDSNSSLCEAASSKFDKKAKVFCADATDENFLSEEGITSFDLAICCTHNHEMNMVLAAFLENLGVGQSVALVESAAFASIARKLGVDVAVPLRDTVVDSIMGHLRGKNVLDVHTVAGGDMQIIECIVNNSAVIGKSLKDISLPGVFLVLLIKPQGAPSFTLPSGNTALNAGDSLIIIVRASRSIEIVQSLGESL